MEAGARVLHRNLVAAGFVTHRLPAVRLLRIKAGCMQRVLADSSRRCAWTFTPGSRRCGAKHYTHEAEERNKIKFWFQYVQIEIQKIIIFIFSPLASQPLWLRVFRFQVASSKFLICEFSDSLFFFCFLTLSAACPSSG